MMIKNLGELILAIQASKAKVFIVPLKDAIRIRDNLQKQFYKDKPLKNNMAKQWE